MSSSKLPVMEEFYSIQGEGYHQGSAAYFIRLGGCDVQCHWCDVKESWPLDGHPQKSIDEIVATVKEYPTDKVIITGGEPLIHDLDELSSAFQNSGIQTHLETSGVHPLTGTWDWVSFSPKKIKMPVSGFGDNANELKVVIFHRSDFDFALEWKETVKKNCKLYLQPEWSKTEEMIPAIANFIKEFPEWKISLQIQNYMRIK